MVTKLQVYIITGCSGSGKTTLAREFVESAAATALISGDEVRDFYQDKSIEWNDKYKLTWQNILLLLDNFLNNKIGVIIEYLYVYEYEIENALSIAKKYNAELRYIVLTASEAAIKERLQSRGDPHLIEKALNMQTKLSENSYNKHYLYDGTSVPITKQIDDMKNMKLYSVRLLCREALDAAKNN